MGIEVSQKTAKLCKSIGLTAEQMAFADLVAVGWEPKDAYFVVFRKGMTWVKKALKEEVMKLAASENVSKRIKATRRNVDEQGMSIDASAADELLERATNKEKKLIKLQQILEALPEGSKEYNKINDQIFAITQMKKDEVIIEDKTVHYHLPVNYPTGCQDCLYQRCESCMYKKEYDKRE
jgi:hypothetical protein